MLKIMESPESREFYGPNRAGVEGATPLLPRGAGRVVMGSDKAIEQVAVLAGVREYAEGFSVELWRTTRGRLTVRAYNEDSHNYTDIDLFDLLQSLSGSGMGVSIDLSGSP